MTLLLNSCAYMDVSHADIAFLRIFFFLITELSHLFLICFISVLKAIHVGLHFCL